MTNSKHTPTPWEVATDEDGRVAIIKGCSFLTYAFPTDLGFEAGSPEANAAHIVKCVNMHDELVGALLPIAKMEIILEKPDDEDICFVSYGTIKNIKEALKKAGAL